MQRVKLGLVCLSWICLAGAVSAQTAVDPTGSSGIASTSGTATVQQDMSGGGVLNGTYFDLRHVVGDGVGYQNSYSQIGAFTPIWFEEDTLIAPNARLIVTNNTQTGVNAGLVARRYLSNWDRLVGVYSYYDNDQDSRNFRYEQVTIGAETLGNWWDLRANGYIVSGNNDNFIGALGVSGNPYYVGHNIDFLGKQLRDQAIGGADVEAGIPLTPSTPWLRGYSGAYGYRVGSGTTIGYRGRIEATISNDLTLGVMVSQDSIYGTNVNGTIDFKFSGYNPTRYFPNMTTRQRMLNPVQRNWRIATHTYVHDVNIAAINPETNKPYFVAHVDNSNANPGDGTIENPYRNLQSAPQADIILVHLGNATSVANAVTGSAVLTNNQRLLGDGVLSTANLFAQYGSNSISGVFNLPGTSNSGNYAYVKNPAGNVVTLANYNEVAGLNLIGSTGSAITNTAGGSHNFYLHNLEIADNGGKGIGLTSASGIGIINNINVGTTNHANPFGLGNNTGGGIVMSTGGPGLDLSLANVFMNANPVGSQAVGVSLVANLGSLNVDMSNVTTNGNTTGISLSESSQLLTANMNLVRANNNAGVGIKVQGTGGEITILANNIAAMNNGSDNIQIGTKLAPIVTSTVNVRLNDANFNGSVGGSGIVFSQSGGTGNLYLPATSSIGNGVDGLGIFGSNNAIQNVTVIDGQFQNNVQDAFHVEGNTGATINLFVDPTNASGSGRNGLYMALGTDSVLNATFLNDSLDNSGNSAVHGELANNATANLYFDGTTGANSGGDGFYLNAINGSRATVSVLHGTFAASNRLGVGSSAINIISDHSTIGFLANMTPANNQLVGSPTIGNQQYGLKLDLQNSSVFDGAIQNGNLSDNLVNAINVNVANTSDATLSIYNTPGLRSGGDGFVADVSNHSTLATTFTLSDLNNSGLNGVKFNVSGASTMSTTFDNSNINNSGNDGINATVADANSVATVTMKNGGTVNNSGGNGLSFNVSTGALQVNAYSSSFSNSGLNGVLGTVSTGGLTVLDFANTAINNNTANGVFVTANTGGNIQATFGIQSISNNGLTTDGDGIRFDLDGTTNSLLNLVNGASVTGNANNGVSILAQNLSVFTSTFQNASILNNGASATAPTRAGVDVTASNSTVTMNFIGTSIGNSSVGGTQQVGFNSDVNTTGTLTTTFQSSNLTNNAANAINSTVESASHMTMNLVNTTGNSSGNTGAVFNVIGASDLLLNSFYDASVSPPGTSGVNSGFSNNGGGGLLVSVDGASTANLFLDQIQLNNNGSTFGGQGFLGFVTGGSTLNAVIQDGSSITANSNQGLEIIAANANSKVNVQITETDVNNNGSEGVLLSISDNAQLNYRSVFNNYNGNGFNGTLDGVSVTTTGNGPSDTAIARLLFAGDNVSNNAGNGFSLNASNGATLTTSMTSVTATGNAGYGVGVSAVDTFTKFNLIMNGANTFTGNGLGPISPLTFSNIDQAVIALTGVFNGSSGDGINASYNNVNTALFSLTGPGTVSNNAGDGVDVSMTNVNNGSILLNGVTAIDNNTSDGVRITLDNSTAGLDIFGTTEVAGNGARGVDIALGNNSSLISNVPTGATLIDVLTLTDNQTPVTPAPMDNILPQTVSVSLNSLGVVAQSALFIQGLNVSNSGAEGISISLNASTIQSGQTRLYDNTVTGSQGDGIKISAANVSSIDGMRIAGTSSNSNTGNGLDIVGNNSTLTNIVVADGSSFSTNGLDGIRFSADTTTLTNVTIQDSTISGNGTSGTGQGINFTGSGGTVANSTLDNLTLSRNTINLNKNDGFHLVNPGTLNSVIHASFVGNAISQNVSGAGVNVQLLGNQSFTGGFDGNTISNNGTQGVNFKMGANGHVNSDFTNNVINGNGAEGINIALGTNGEYVGTSFYGNTIGTLASPNGSFGIHLTAPDLAGFSLNLGDITKAANSLVGNSNAGVGIDMTGASTGNLNIANTTITNSKAGSNASYSGEGLRINQGGSSVLSGGISNSNFSSNAADGAMFNVTGNNVGIFASLNNFSINQSTFNSNGGNGLEFFRTADGEVNNVTVTNSSFNNNSQNGLVIRAANKFGGHIDTYTINSNTISNNGFNGVLFDERADAHITANMNLNVITNNAGNGIQLVEQVNNSSDLRRLSGTWTQNTITGNQGNGIALDGATSNLVIGDLNSYALGNDISNNKLSGIEVSGAGSLTIGSNLIQGNGTLSNLGTANENAGLLLNVAPTSAITVSHNIITDNLGDGIQWGIRSNFDGFFSSIDINNNNLITDNSGRGIDIINRGNNDVRVNIENNFVSANDLEGIYVVNTASTTQDQFSSSTTPLVADGNVLNDPRMQLRIVGNQVIGNGLNSGLSGTGLVIRVGTSDGSNSIFDNGGFAGNGAAVAQGASAATFFGSITSTRGGVIAQVDNNILGGNFGDDVLFHSFVSTVTPVTTTGTWTATDFTVTTYESDPLSRFDLYFRGNTTDSGSIDSLGSSLNGYSSRDAALVAFYNNAEGTFKSRTIAATPTTNDGPFTSDIRARNATRQAARIPSFLNPQDGSNNTYLYPGMGSSTWRASSDSTAILLPGLTDLASPLTNTNQAQGFFLSSPPGNGEQPYGWGTY